MSNAPKNVKEMEKWVGELSTELSLVQIRVEARTILEIKVSHILPIGGVL